LNATPFEMLSNAIAATFFAVAIAYRSAGIARARAVRRNLRGA